MCVAHAWHMRTVDAWYMHGICTVSQGRLKRILVVDAPTSFWALWAVVRATIDEETAAIIEFVPWEDVPHRYPALFGDALGARMLTEARGNRDPACVAAKTWTTFFADE